MSNQPAILTVTLNPALDMTGQLDQLQPGEVNVIGSGSIHPAGKGVNVARVLSDLGLPVVVTGLLGETNQQPFVELFSQIGVTDQFVRIPGSSRINVKLVEQCAQVTDLNFPGISVTGQDCTEIGLKLMNLAHHHELIVIAGSLPLGITPETFRQWLAELTAQGKKVVLDSSGAALKAGLQAAPWLVKPNERELSDWVGHELTTEDDLMAAGEQLASTGIHHIVISRGAQGVLWLHQNRWRKAVPPSVEVVSTVGAGDTLVAGMCWGLYMELDPEHVLAFATALSVFAVSQTGVGVQDKFAVDRLAETIPVEMLLASSQK